MRWHCPPDTEFEIRALAVWCRVRYLSVTEAPHNTEFHTWMGRKHFVSFKPPRPGTEPRTLAWKAAVLTTTHGWRWVILTQLVQTWRLLSSINLTGEVFGVCSVSAIVDFSYRLYSLVIWTILLTVSPSINIHALISENRMFWGYLQMFEYKCMHLFSKNKK